MEPLMPPRFVALVCAALVYFAASEFLSMPHAASAGPASGGASANLAAKDLLVRNFASPDLSYLVLDLRANSLVAANGMGAIGRFLSGHW